MTRPCIRICLIGGLLLLAGAAFAEQGPKNPQKPAAEQPSRKIPDTLMFTIDEFNDIQGHQSGSAEDASSKSGGEAENVSLYLSTILYYGPKDWTIWVNGVPISPDQTFSSFKVTEITPSYVELLVPLSAQGMRPVRLGPNQTFMSKSGIVVEGRQP